MSSFTIGSATEKARRLRRFDPIGLNRTLHGYYYIAHYFPLRAQDEITAEDADKLLAKVDVSQGFEAYIHFPFCEVICSFCHFMKELGGASLGEKENDILGAVEKEIEMYASRLGTINAHSLQLGGGTPSLMSNAGLRRILGVVNKHFRFDASAEKKIELFPKHYDAKELREKLAILKDHGFTDIVIDLESGNPQSLKTIGRGITSLEAYLEVVEESTNAGFTSIVTALMMGLPHETFDSLEATVQTLLKVPEVQVVNTFPTIIREPDPIFRQCQQRPDWFPSAEMRDAMWIMTRDLFREAGFREGPISYLHSPSKRPQQQSDKFECVNLIAFGPSAFGYWNGEDWSAQCFNHCNLDDYYRRIRQNQLPLWRAGVADNTERARRKLIFGLANCKTENLVELERRFGISVDDTFGQMLNGLYEQGLIRIDKTGHGVYYTEEGLCRLEEISYFFGSDWVNQRANLPVSPTDPHHDELLRHHYYPAIRPEDEASFKSFVEQHPNDFMRKLN